MPETTENYDLIRTAQESVEPHQLTDGRWLVRDSQGQARVINLTDEIERDQQHPNRKTGKYTVTDVPSFSAYLAKHGIDATELWGNRDAGTIRSVINAHDGDPADGEAVAGFDDDGQTGIAGWGDHTLTLQLRHSDDWKDWTSADGKLVTQVDFAEFIEDHRPNFGKPTAAEMLELAQTFRSTSKVEFNSSHRVKSGETSLTYAEVHDAKAGKKGELSIPDEISIAMPVYDQGKPYLLTARLRYRINNGQLVLGYKLNRPKDPLQTAFDDVVVEVQSTTNRVVWATA